VCRCDFKTETLIINTSPFSSFLSDGKNKFEKFKDTMDIEIDNETPDFKCKKCKNGIIVFNEEYWEGEFDLECPACKTKHKLKRELIEKITLCE